MSVYYWTFIARKVSSFELASQCIRYAFRALGPPPPDCRVLDPWCYRYHALRDESVQILQSKR